jgi:hypothetical protein
MTARQSAIEHLPDERQRIIDVFDHLRGHDGLEFEITRDVLNPTGKHFGIVGSSDRRDLRGKFSSETAIKERAGFIEEITVTAADFQKLAAGQAAFLEICQ